MKKNKKADEPISEVILRHAFAELENKFWNSIDSELQKIEVFYRTELQNARKRVDEIIVIIDSGSGMENPEILAVLEENIVETYRGLDLLMNYCQYNAAAIRQFVNRWDGNNVQLKIGV